jgi:hypothetical protein
MEVVRCDLFLVAAVRGHTPNLYRARAFGVERNVLSAQRVLGATIKSLEALWWR